MSAVDSCSFWILPWKIPPAMGRISDITKVFLLFPFAFLPHDEISFLSVGVI